MPRSLRGAKSMSVTIRLAGFAGSTSKWTMPASFSYGPASP